MKLIVKNMTREPVEVETKKGVVVIAPHERHMGEFSAAKFKAMQASGKFAIEVVSE